MMEYQEIIPKILPEHTEEQGEVARIVLEYAEQHPEIFFKQGGSFRERALSALPIVVGHIFGHPLDYYFGRSRVREKLDVRYIVYLFLRDELRMSLNEIGKVFGVDHSTILFALRSARNLLDTFRPFRQDYKRFKNYYLTLL